MYKVEITDRLTGKRIILIYKRLVLSLRIRNSKLEENQWPGKSFTSIELNIRHICESFPQRYAIMHLFTF